jgi:hypothetical protein
MSDDAPLVVTTPADSLIQVLPAPEHGRRMETGPLQFGDDWPGVFLRGDHALPAAFYLSMFLEAHPPKEGDDPITRHYVESLLKDLISCDATGVTTDFVTKAKPAGNGGW